jgi:hypothetical protein
MRQRHITSLAWAHRQSNTDKLGQHFGRADGDRLDRNNTFLMRARSTVGI